MSELKKTKIAIYAVASILLALIIIFVLNAYQGQNIVTPGLIQTPEYNFVVLVNDPPVLPSAQVSALYLNYSDILIHSVSGSWIRLNQSGSINLLSVENNAIIVYVSKIPNGEYNILRFEGLTSSVIYNGQIYPVKVTSSYVDSYPISKLQVNNKNTTFVDVIFYPKLFILPDNKGGIQFLLILKSKSLGFYDYKKIFGEISEQKLNQILKKGNSVSIIGTELYTLIYSEISSQKISIANVDLSEEGLEIEVINNGNVSVQINYVILYVSKSSMHASSNLSYIIFLVNSDGTLVPVTSINNLIHKNETGFILQPGSEANLSYSGEINLIQVTNEHALKGGISKLKISAGDKITIVIVGEYSILATSQIILTYGHN